MNEGDNDHQPGVIVGVPSKPHGQELLAHIKLATSFLAIYIGLLTRFSVPLDLRGHSQETPSKKHSLTSFFFCF